MVDKIGKESEETDEGRRIQALIAEIQSLKDEKQSLKDDLEFVEDELSDTLDVLSDIYSKSTRFIVELLQNAEDAIGQNCHPKSRTVQFELKDDALVFSHYGKLFDKKDKDSIRRAASTSKAKSKDTIGKFGIGFKSVYNFTETPRISSGPAHDPDYHFQIINRRKLEPIKSLNGEDSEKTTIELPFKSGLQNPTKSIGEGLNELDGKTILFLRHITRIEWQTPDGSGFLERTETNEDTYVRSVTVNSSSQDKVEHWLIFNGGVLLSKEDKATSEDKVTSGDKVTSEDKVNSLEIAFHQSKTDDGNWPITKPGRDLYLSVYFPTKEKTHLGFHVQGKFELVPSRENIEEDNKWNKHLINKTGELLVVALLWLKQKKKLDKGGLECLPIEQEFFRNGNDRLFAPVAKRLVTALREKELLPTANHGYCKAEDAAYPITAKLTEIFNIVQLETLFNRPNIRWLSKIECSPLLKDNYLKKLDILEIKIEGIINKLNEDFLKDQEDSWIREFYAFLSGQSSLFNAIKQKPILRLEDGRHVCHSSTVYLPPEQGGTQYDCVKRELLKGDNGKDARKFLEGLPIIELDLVADALKRVEDYDCERKTLSITQYEKDLKTILDATESEATDERKDVLYEDLKDATIVLVDTADGKLFKKPDQVYLPTDDLKTLIGDMESTLFADETIIKEEMYGWMKRCGVHDHLRIKECRHDRHDKECRDDKAWQDLFEIMKEEYKYDEKFWYEKKENCTEYTIPELDHIFCKIDTVEQEKKADLSKRLWDQMKNVELKDNYWTATISWGFSGRTESRKLRSKITRQLNDTAWILDPDDGNLKKPSEIFFPKDWDKHPRPFKNIPFMEPEVFDYFMSKGIPEENARALSEKYPTLEELDKRLVELMDREAKEYRAAKEKPVEEEPIETSANSDSGDTPHTSGLSYPRPNRNGEPTQPSEHFTGGAVSTALGKSKTSSGGSSAVMVINLGDALNTKTEDAAINFVLKEDLDLIDANEDNPNNPGYDLHNKKKDRFIEVKGVSGEFTWVSMTITQFKCAMEKGDQYWLYVVEYAESDEPKLYKLHDLARSLTEANVIIKKDGQDWQ